MTASLVVTNARIRTMEAGNPTAEAVAVQGETILAVGSMADIADLTGPDTQVIDAGGATVLPGFIESHMHLFVGGAELDNLQLEHCPDPRRMADLLRTYSDARPDVPLLMAQGPDYDIFGDRPPRLFLDDILPDRPVALMADDHHTVWANTMALEQAGLLHGYDTPEGHEVVMGSDGTATGMLLEPEAYVPVLRLGGTERVILGLHNGRDPDPAPDAAGREADLVHLKRGLAHAGRHGITSIVNMDGNPYTLELLDTLRERGELTQRVRVPFHFVPEMEESDLETAAMMHARWADDWLASGFVKLFMDGVIDSRTAFMLNDYPGHPGHRAHGRFSAERFASLATRIDAMGLQIAVHAIGDAAIRRVIDGYEAARTANGDTGLRHRIEHLELVAPSDFARLGPLGITASLQPPHAPGAANFPLHPTLDVIGRDRWEDAFAWQRLVASGAPVALASDWPVSPITVLGGLHAATMRPAWTDDVPDHRFTLDAALAGYTIGGAYAERTEARKGSLTPGKLADIVILDRDIGAGGDILLETNVSATITGGRVVYEG